MQVYSISSATYYLVLTAPNLYPIVFPQVNYLYVNAF